MTNKPACKTCQYWAQTYSECRAGPPIVGKDQRFPLSMGFEWCGKHKPVKKIPLHWVWAMAGGPGDTAARRAAKAPRDHIREDDSLYKQPIPPSLVIDGPVYDVALPTQINIRGMPLLAMEKGEMRDRVTFGVQGRCEVDVIVESAEEWLRSHYTAKAKSEKQ